MSSNFRAFLIASSVAVDWHGGCDECTTQKLSRIEMLDKIWTTQDIFRIKHTKRFQQGYGICISNIYG